MSPLSTPRMETGSAIHHLTTSSCDSTPAATTGTSSGMGSPRPAQNSVTKTPTYVKCSMMTWTMAYTGARVSTSRRRVVLHTESSLGLGGQEIRILTESRWLREHDWDVVIAGQPDGRLRTEAKIAGLPFVTVRMRSAVDLIALGALRRIIRERDVAIVHTHSSSDSWLGAPAARVVSVPAGVDTTRFHPGVSGKTVRDELGLTGPVVGLVANIRGSKGHNDFLDAALMAR